MVALTPDQKRTLLKNIGCLVGDKSAAYGWIVGDDLHTSNQPAVTYSQPPDIGPPVAHGLSVAEGYSFSKFVSNLQRNQSTDISYSVGIPDIFSTDASYAQSATAETKSDVTDVYFQRTITFHKQNIKFDQKDFVVNPDFVAEAEKAVEIAETDLARGARTLIDAMSNTWGQFVALTLIAGGRLTLSAVQHLSDLTQIDKTKSDFSTAVDATIILEDLPIKLDSKYNLEWAQSSEVQKILHSWTIKIDVVGGDEALAYDKKNYQGWLDSVSDFETWKVVGFASKTLVPIGDIISDDNIRTEVGGVLIYYFASQLVQRETISAGHVHDHEFGPSNIGDISGLKSMHVYWGTDLCKLNMTYSTYAGSDVTYTTNTPNNGDTNKDFTFDSGARIKSLHVRLNPNSGRNADIVQGLQIKVASGVVYPGDNSYFGTNSSSNLVHVVLEAPRVRAIVGSFGAVVHELRLRYLYLSDETLARDYMLVMEPYLFPDGNYGDFDQGATLHAE